MGSAGRTIGLATPSWGSGGHLIGLGTPSDGVRNENDGVDNGNDGVRNESYRVAEGKDQVSNAISRLFEGNDLLAEGSDGYGTESDGVRQADGRAGDGEIKAAMLKYRYDDAKLATESAKLPAFEKANTHQAAATRAAECLELWGRGDNFGKSTGCRRKG